MEVTASASDEQAALLERVAAGDVGEPLAGLYRLYGSRLFGLGLRLLGERGMAEEMVQETFVRLWRSAPRYDPARGTVKTFVFTIARRVAVDQLRRSASRPLAWGNEPAKDEPTNGDFDALVLSLDVRDAIEGLPRKHRSVLELILDEDLSQHAIAERLGIPLGTVKTRSFYGMRALRLELEERGLV